MGSSEPVTNNDPHQFIKTLDIWASKLTIFNLDKNGMFVLKSNCNQQLDESHMRTGSSIDHVARARIAVTLKSATGSH